MLPSSPGSTLCLTFILCFTAPAVPAPCSLPPPLDAGGNTCDKEQLCLSTKIIRLDNVSKMTDKVFEVNVAAAIVRLFDWLK